MERRKVVLGSYQSHVPEPSPTDLSFGPIPLKPHERGYWIWVNVFNPSPDLKDNWFFRNGFEDDDIGQWTFTIFPPNWGQWISYGNSADDKIYGEKEGFMAITDKYTLGVAMSSWMSISFTQKPYLRAEWWMKYSGSPVPNDPAHYSPHYIFISMGGGYTPIIYWFFTDDYINVWYKYRAVMVSGNIKVYRLVNGTWVNIYDNTFGGMSGDFGFRIDSANSNNTDYGTQVYLDELRLYDVPA